MLQKIEALLQEVCPLVWYGSADELKNGALWNYIVFSRARTRRSESKTGFSDYYRVAIVHENWVPDEMVEDTISKLETLPGMRLASEDIDYAYSRKPGTNATVEVAVLTFCRARKRV